MTIRSYSEMKRLDTLVERFQYLSLRGRIGDPTFGFDRWMNQAFYRSSEWRQIRHHVILRDNGCDLGVPEYEIRDRLYIHHMNPLTLQDLRDGAEAIIDPEFLITTVHQTHNAIHYGTEDQLPRPFLARRAGDTKLW